ncbi:MAG: ATP-binding protein [Alphaproteobacteria bacterium]|nr:ATP-binding protein [Alphaproteobacteria bacterium]
MSSGPTKIPFSIDVTRMIELLAAQIYPSPFALLRENTQNSFDAILLRKHLGQAFEPAINITITPEKISISDNGVGMTSDELKNHYWRAGSSSKNNPNAKAAGVVGTFGIGAMANFGIAENLIVESESAVNPQRTRCVANRATLSVTQDCIETIFEAPTGSPGTTVTALLQPGKSVNVDQAKSYISEFVAYVPIAVTVNGALVSQRPFQDVVPQLSSSWTHTEGGVDLGNAVNARVDLHVAANGEVRLVLTEFQVAGQKLEGRMELRQGIGALRTFRSLFGLATVSLNSAYQLGGAADFLFLQPTAGREALTSESMQRLQEIITGIDNFISVKFSGRPESNSNTNFMTWVTQRGAYNFCDHLVMRVEPNDQNIKLVDLKAMSATKPLLIYAGTDPEFIKHASEDQPLVILSRSNPRRQCEHEYLRKYCKIDELKDEPSVLESISQATSAQNALGYRISSILSTDYFLETQIRFGKISHALPVLVTKRVEPVEIFLDPSSPSVQQLLALFDREYEAFGNMAKDFVRNIIFSRVSDLVPSATRQGAEAFLKTIQRSREVFEIEAGDHDSLTSIWTDYYEGKLSIDEAARRSSLVAHQAVQVIDTSAAGSVRDVVPGVIENEQSLGNAGEQGREYVALPPIERRDIPTEKKLLTITDQEPDLRGFRCFLAITERVREEKGHFFLQPHRTSIVWGGQKVLFIFEHHSGEFGLYYDIQASNVIGEQPGGGAVKTCTIVMKNKIFVPIPEKIRPAFTPTSAEKRRLEIRCEILYTTR